jgi:hypothetical protein
MGGQRNCLARGAGRNAGDSLENSIATTSSVLRHGSRISDTLIVSNNMNDATRRGLRTTVVSATQESGPSRASQFPPGGASTPRAGAGFAAIVKNTGPEELWEVASLEQSEFLALYGDSLLLLVHIRDADKDLAAGLSVTAVRGEANLPPEPLSICTKTNIDPFEATPHSPKPRPVETEIGVIQLLASGRHFAVPLRKRITADNTHPNRVSLGRAPNKDIVLRHETVSKDHCWFEVDEGGSFFVTDAGSKNLTRLNGRPLPDGPTFVRAGDTLRFGLIDAQVCSARTLWRVLGTAIRRAK